MLLLWFEFTDHCRVQVGGDVEDFVQTHGRVDAFVLFASAKKRHAYKQIQTGITETERGRERERERGNVNFKSFRVKIFAATMWSWLEVHDALIEKENQWYVCQHVKDMFHDNSWAATCHTDLHNVHSISTACFLMGQDLLKQHCSIWTYNDCGSVIPVTEGMQLLSGERWWKMM